MKTGIPILILLAILSACASKNIIIDEKGVDMTKYEIDLAECQGYSDQVDTTGEVVSEGARGAVVGALLGAVTGDSDDVQQAAAAGAVIGAAHGQRKGSNEEQRVVKQCLIGRGYRVLN